MKNDGTLKSSEGFTEQLTGFTTAEEWWTFGHDFALNAARKEFSSSVWDIDRLFLLLKRQVEELEEKKVAVEEKLFELGIKDTKITWIKEPKLAEFKDCAEKFQYAVLNLQKIIGSLEILKTELQGTAKKYECGLKMAYEHVLRLCTLFDETKNVAT